MDNLVSIPTAQTISHFHDALRRLRSAEAWQRPQQLPPLLAIIGQLLTTAEGTVQVYQHSIALEQAGVFADSPWENPRHLAAPLVGGTLHVGGTTTLLELVSELRMLAYATEEGTHQDTKPTISAAEATRFLEDVVVHNLEWAFPGATEHTRDLATHLQQAVSETFALLLTHLPTNTLKQRLADEVQVLAAQRPIVTVRIRALLAKVHSDVVLEPDQLADQLLQHYLDALYAPSPLAKQQQDADGYATAFAALSAEERHAECSALSQTMLEHGLVSDFHPLAVRAVRHDGDLLATLLGLDAYGRAQLDNHHTLLQTLIERAIAPETAQAVYGLARLLERGLLSREPVANSLKRLMALEMHPEVRDNIAHVCRTLTPRDRLLADVLSVLGQPLGISQGSSPTCQSARGLSLWSQHAPGKLLDMVLSAATSNNLAMRFDEQVLNSQDLPQGLVDTIDARLDAVSIVLVPHLDRLYNEMMRRASLRLEDPHKWVNPALYGHWIPTGFISAYDTASQSIRNYDTFVRTFYATHHPAYNGGHDLVYPNPVGLFITASSGKLLGFHAVSLLRVGEHAGQVRVYFLNPNDEGRQDWGQGITPTVANNGERPGESSLPFAHFAARLYAFHYNERDLGDLGNRETLGNGGSQTDIDGAAIDAAIDEVTQLAKDSWGKTYIWLN